MKRILFLSFYFRPDLCAGSFRNSPLLDELSRQTKNDDIRIHVYTTIPNRYATFNSSYEPVEEFDNVRIERIEVPPHQSGKRDQVLSFRKYYFETIKKSRNTYYDLVYASSSRFFTSWLAYKIARRKNCPLYVDVRDVFSETIGNISQNPVLKTFVPPFISQLEKRVYSYASHINLISEGFKNSFQDITTATFSYFTHGVDPVFMEKPKVEPPPNPSDKKKILYAGNVGEGQGLHKIIPDVAENLQDKYEIEIIGDGGAMGKLESALSEKQVNNVVLTNPVKRKKLVEKYYQSDILFIHLNDFDIFKKVLPSKIFELAVIGKPVLAGVSGYAKEFLQKHVPQSFIFKPGDVNGMLKQIKNIEQDNSEFNAGQNQKFAESFSREEINEKMAKSIIKLL